MKMAGGFLVAKRANGMAVTTLSFCQKKLEHFIRYCEARLDYFGLRSMIARRGESVGHLQARHGAFSGVG